MTPKLATLFCILAPLASAQAVDGTFHFTTPQTAQGMQEAATVLRTVADIPTISVDAAQASLLFNGPADQVAFSEWLLPRLDVPANGSAAQEYQLPNGDVAWVNYLMNVKNAQGMQEVLTIVRTVADIQKIFNFTHGQAIVMRGKPGDVAFAEWIINHLNQPAQNASPLEFTVDPSYPRMGTVARINFLKNIRGPHGTQELLTVLRTVADIQKVFNYTASAALVLRSTDPGIALAEWLIQNLDQSPDTAAPGAHLFNASTGDDVTRIFYIANATQQSLLAAASGIRGELKNRHVFYTTSPATLVVRGTTDQIEAAAQFLAAHNAIASLR